MAKFDTLNGASWVLLGKLTFSGTSTVTTSLIDMQGYDALDICVLNATINDAGTASGHTIKLQESDLTTAVSFTDVATINGVNSAVTVSTTLDADDDKIAGVLGYVGGKRYVRASGTGTTLSDGIVYVMGRRSRGGIAKPVTIIGAATAAT